MRICQKTTHLSVGAMAQLFVTLAHSIESHRMYSIELGEHPPALLDICLLFTTLYIHNLNCNICRFIQLYITRATNTLTVNDKPN